MRPFRSPQWSYAAFVIVLTIAAAGILACMQHVANAQNRTSIDTQQQIAGSLIDSLLSSLASNVSAETYWQEAYQSTTVKWDQAWVDWEYGGYLKSLDVPIGLVYSADGVLKFRYEDAAVKSLAQDRLNQSASLHELLDAVVRRAPQTPPAVSRGFLSIDGTLFYGAAAYVTPEHGAITDDPSRRYVLVFLREMVPSRYTGIARYIHTSGFEITGPQAKIPGKVALPLQSTGGRVMAQLWWTPYQPGSALLATMVPVAIGIFAILGIVLILILRKWQALTANAYAANARALAAQEENRAKSAFLGSLSHELRTPLNAIIGFSDVIKQELLGPVGVAQYKDYIKHIHSSGNHLLRIVNDLLEMVRLENKGVSVSCAMADAREIIEETCTMLQIQADDKGISLVRPVAPALSKAYFDRHALLRVLINIVSNALKFTLPGGEVAILLEADEEYLSIIVRDNGIGIMAKDLERLGNPFTQVGDHHSRGHQGTGLGLSISKRLVQLMNGKLSIASTFGEGTTVSVKVPLHEPGAAHVESNASAHPKVALAASA
jgi:signal transduction histidine kinase